MKRLRPLNIVGIILIGLVLGTVAYIGGVGLLTPYGVFMFVIFALAIVVMFADFFPNDDDKKS